MPTARAKAKANAPLCAANQRRPQSHPQTLPMLPLHSVAVAAAAVESNCAENFSPVRSVRVCLCVRFLCNACVCCPASLRVRRRNGPLASLAHMHTHAHTLAHETKLSSGKIQFRHRRVAAATAEVLSAARHRGGRGGDNAKTCTHTHTHADVHLPRLLSRTRTHTILQARAHAGSLHFT